MELPFDVARCVGGSCEKKYQCHRYLASLTDKEHPNRIVSYFMKPPIVNGDCEYKIPMEEK